MNERLNAIKRGLSRMGSGQANVIWVLAAAAIVVGMGFFSVVDIEPGEAAVRVNNITGAQEAVTRPGWMTRIPGLHSVYVLDARPQTFHMSGEGSANDPLNVSELSVRASDGSNFHFTDTTILFQLSGSEAVKAVRDAGAGDSYLQWMRPYARAILRDEFGRESTIDVSNPATYGTAAGRAKERLNAVLEPHGVKVTQLVTPRPRFSEGYEKAIEDRNALSNELEVIQSNLNRAETNRSRLLAEVDQEKNAVIQQKRAGLEADLAKAVAAQAQTKREADTYRIEKIAAGQASLSAAKRQAQELTGELRAKYQSKQAEIAAFSRQPVERVMEKLGEKLEGVTIDIQPYAEDATPTRLNVKQLGGAQ